MLKKVTRIILAGIASIAAYNIELPKLRVCRKCPCGTPNSLHSHGHYNRKSQRNTKDVQSLIPVKILRFICKLCYKTCSPLPECIPTRRWYPWKVQQFVIQEYLNGNSWKEISSKTGVSISTCKRWCKWFLDKYDAYATALKNVAGNIGSVLRDTTGEFKQFWQKCFEYISLDRAMLLCHQAGIDVP